MLDSYQGYLLFYRFSRRFLSRPRALFLYLLYNQSLSKISHSQFVHKRTGSNDIQPKHYREVLSQANSLFTWSTYSVVDRLLITIRNSRWTIRRVGDHIAIVLFCISIERPKRIIERVFFLALFSYNGGLCPFLILID